MTTEFPTIVYKCPGSHHCAGGTFDFIQVKDETELEEKIKSGYRLSITAALNMDLEDEDEDEDQDEDEDGLPTREELEEKAKELNIKFNKRTSNDRLLDLIEKSLS